jgi:hypothetical protein
VSADELTLGGLDLSIQYVLSIGVIDRLYMKLRRMRRCFRRQRGQMSPSGRIGLSVGQGWMGEGHGGEENVL